MSKHSHKADSSTSNLINKINKLAGRNLFQAIGVALVFIFVIFITIAVLRPLFPVLISIIGVFLIVELAKMFKTKKLFLPVAMICIASTTLIFTAFFSGITALSLMFFLIFFILLIYVAIYPDKSTRIKTATGFSFVFVYITLSLSFACLILRDLGGLALLLAISIIISTDFGGYLVGRSFGRIKIFPVLSPNKTLTGLLGSIIVSVIASYTFCFATPIHISDKFVFPLIIAVVSSLFAVLGDLGESLIKRSFNVKDSSNMLAGHGGFMDRIDSSLLLLPVFYFLFFFFI